MLHHPQSCPIDGDDLGASLALSSGRLPQVAKRFDKSKEQ